MWRYAQAPRASEANPWVAVDGVEFKEVANAKAYVKGMRCWEPQYNTDVTHYFRCTCDPACKSRMCLRLTTAKVRVPEYRAHMTGRIRYYLKTNAMSARSGSFGDLMFILLLLRRRRTGKLSWTSWTPSEEAIQDMS